MRKLILFLTLMAFSFTCAMGQTNGKVETTSTKIKFEPKVIKPKIPKTWNIYLMAGPAYFSGFEKDGVAGDFTIGFQKNLKSHGMYWGLETGYIHNRYFKPLSFGPTFGLQKKVSDYATLTGGIGFSYAYENEYCTNLLIPQLNLGVWLKSFYVGINAKYIYYLSSHWWWYDCDFSSVTTVGLKIGVKF